MKENQDKINITTDSILPKIDTPVELRKLEVQQLPQLCKELREFMIDELSKNPGHFASSMGSVELTVAMHYVFDTPYDRIVWDVGHQAYSHKILTGRKDRFHTNRTMGGLSGFPSPTESKYDSFTAGHASNSISAALGMSIASRINGDNPKRKVVAVIGDASISGGLAFEGLNNASNSNNNLLIILNDNDMAIDRNVGALNHYMTHITISKGYNKLRYKTYNLLRKLHILKEKHRVKILRFNNSIKSLLSNHQNIFEGLNIRYFGPFDGHDIEKLVEILNDIKEMDGPRILHLRTIKGKGYTPAENNPAKWHAPGKFDKETGEHLTNSNINQPLKYQDIFGHTLVELADKDNTIVGITAAMPSGCSMNYMLDKYPERTFDVGISEGHAVTFAGGLAKDGLKPFCCIYSTFLQRAYDNIIHDIAIQSLPVVLCIDRAGIVGEDGVTHHGVFDMAYLNTVPNLIISSPINEHSLRNLMLTAQQCNDAPFVIRYPRGEGVLSDWKNQMQPITIGEGEKLNDGTDIAILSIGAIGNNVIKAIKELKESDNISIAHYDMIFLKPIDTNILREVGEKYKTVITVEDGTIIGGLGSSVIEWFNDNGCSNVNVSRIGIPDKFIHHGSVSQLHKLCKMDIESIKAKIKELITPLK